MMRDCGNAEMRDLLPDLLHAGLAPVTRAEVERHVATCDDCAAELRLLRRAQASMALVPAVDVSRIVAALPRVGARRRSSRFTGWRAAAGIAAVLLGAVSLRVVRQAGTPVNEPATGSVAASAPATAGSATGTDTMATAVAAVPSSVASAPRAARAPVPTLTPAGGLADLSNDDLERLLGKFDGLTGVPDTEPDADVSPVTLDEGVS